MNEMNRIGASIVVRFGSVQLMNEMHGIEGIHYCPIWLRSANLIFRPTDFD
uniref:Uncharacterized protein n=1 Tax=Solanum lycopersicum TaxID=4081 RepID=A0A3Q7FFY0_SOLLC